MNYRDWEKQKRMTHEMIARVAILSVTVFVVIFFLFGGHK